MVLRYPCLGFERYHHPSPRQGRPSSRDSTCGDTESKRRLYCNVERSDSPEGEICSPSDRSDFHRRGDATLSTVSRVNIPGLARAAGVRVSDLEVARYREIGDSISRRRDTENKRRRYFDVERTASPERDIYNRSHSSETRCGADATLNTCAPLNSVASANTVASATIAEVCSSDLITSGFREFGGSKIPRPLSDNASPVALSLEPRL